MALPRLPPLVLLLLVAVAAPALPSALGCTTILVGGQATTDGSIFIARNVDLMPGVASLKAPQNLVSHPARPSTAALFKSNFNKFNISLPAPGQAYTALPLILAAQSSRGNDSFEESGINGAGLTVSATETIMSSAKALKKDPLKKKYGLSEDAIPSIILPHPLARSARSGAALLGSVVEQYGSAEGFGVLFADVNEAWYLENAVGHHWLAQRVPADTFFVSANQGRFTTANLSDSANVMHSPELQNFAVQSNLSQAGQPFDFHAAYFDNAPDNVRINHVRVCALVQRYAGTNMSSCLAAMPNVPSFLRPASKLGVGDVMAGLRDHFEGTSHDRYTLDNASEPWRPIFVLRTSLAHVTRTRPRLPSGLSIINYVAMGPPALAPFVPLYKGLPPWRYPAALTTAGGSPDPVSLFWKGRRLQALVLQNFSALAPAAKAAILQFEQNVEEVQRPAMEAQFIAAFRKRQYRSLNKIIADFTAAVVSQAGKMMDQAIKAAAQQLGLPGVPSDDKLVAMLEAAEIKFSKLRAPGVVPVAAVGVGVAGAASRVRDYASFPVGQA